jgi:parvulin-like peptidyl-prolyl isomerase
LTHPFDMTAVTVNGEAISLRALVQRARAHDQIKFVEDAITIALVREAARQLEIVVTKTEAQQAANEFREKHNLVKAEDAIRWLTERGLTVIDWQNALEEDVLVAKFKKIRFGPKVASYFAEHKLSFDCATIGRIVVATEGLGSELMLQLREEGAVFEDLARQYSTDRKTKEHGGYVGRVTRKGLGPVASAAVFGAKAGSFEGPFKVGKEFQVLRVIELHPAILDEGTRRIVEDRMFEDWLSEAREKATVEIPLFDAAPEAVEA